MQHACAFLPLLINPLDGSEFEKCQVIRNFNDCLLVKRFKLIVLLPYNGHWLKIDF